jgi:hypothetical protein
LRLARATSRRRGARGDGKAGPGRRAHATARRVHTGHGWRAAAGLFAEEKRPGRESYLAPCAAIGIGGQLRSIAQGNGGASSEASPAPEARAARDRDGPVTHGTTTYSHRVRVGVNRDRRWAPRAWREAERETVGGRKDAAAGPGRWLFLRRKRRRGPTKRCRRRLRRVSFRFVHMWGPLPRRLPVPATCWPMANAVSCLHGCSSSAPHVSNTEPNHSRFLTVIGYCMTSLETSCRV